MSQSNMAREVAEIPDAAARFLAQSHEAVVAAADVLRARDPAVIATIARGSSDHAATYLKYAVELVAGIPVASVGPSIASIYGRPLRLPRGACIGISQSGRSPDIVEMVQTATAGGALSIAITNHADSPMAAASAHCLPLAAGEEKSVAATKTFVNSVLAGLSLLAEWQRDRALQDAIAASPQALARAVALDWSPLVDRLTGASRCFVLGRGPAIAIANEAALKFKEVAGIHGEGYSAAEVLHGPAAIVQPPFPILALGIEDAALPRLAATAERLTAQGAEVFLTGADVAGAVRLPSEPGLHPLIAPLALIASFYAFIEALAWRRGFDPDQPPHLRKVTETV